MRPEWTTATENALLVIGPLRRPDCEVGSTRLTSLIGADGLEWMRRRLKWGRL